MSLRYIIHSYIVYVHMCAYMLYACIQTGARISAAARRRTEASPEGPR